MSLMHLPKKFAGKINVYHLIEGAKQAEGGFVTHKVQEF